MVAYTGLGEKVHEVKTALLWKNGILLVESHEQIFQNPVLPL